jgi:anthranilate phosphoribosyltransferase
MAEVLGRLGVEAAWVVHGHGGLDEIAPAGATRVAKLERGEVREDEVAPSDFGVEDARGDIGGGDAAANARIVRAVLGGDRGAPRTAVILNAAAALRVAGEERDLRAARERAEAAIDSGAALRLLEAWIGLS